MDELVRIIDPSRTLVLARIGAKNPGQKRRKFLGYQRFEWWTMAPARQTPR